MPFVPAPNIIEVEIRYLLFGQKIENRYMVDNLAAVTPAAIEAAAIEGWNWAETRLLPHLSVALHLSEVVATDLTASDGGQFTYAPDTTTNGGQALPVLPNECAFCISLHSAARGRSARGRMFLPAIPVAVMADANTMDGSSANVLVSDVQVLINTIAARGPKFVIVSYRHNNAPRPGGPIYYPVLTAVATDNTIDSQRRRKPGVGA